MTEANETTETTETTEATEATEQKQPAATANATGNDVETITLDAPIQRGKSAVSEVTIRKPLSGALRGVGLIDLLNMDAQALQKVLPRVTEPALSESEVRKLDVADLLQLGSRMSIFLLGKRAQDETE